MDNIINLGTRSYGQLKVLFQVISHFNIILIIQQKYFNEIYLFLHPIISSHAPGRGQNCFNPVWTLIIHTWPANSLCEIMQYRPRRAWHLAKITCLLPVSCRICHASSSTANCWGVGTAVVDATGADGNLVVLNCHFLSILDQ